jgi:hypothetical protein
VKKQNKKMDCRLFFFFFFPYSHFVFFTFPRTRTYDSNPTMLMFPPERRRAAMNGIGGAALSRTAAPRRAPAPPAATDATVDALKAQIEVLEGALELRAAELGLGRGTEGGARLRRVSELEREKSLVAVELAGTTDKLHAAQAEVEDLKNLCAALHREKGTVRGWWGVLSFFIYVATIFSDSLA